MKTSTTILIDLLIGQSTISALAERMRQPAKVLEAFLKEMEIDGLVESSPIGSNHGRQLTAWRLTAAGITVANEASHKLQPA